MKEKLSRSFEHIHTQWNHPPEIAISNHPLNHPKSSIIGPSSQKSSQSSVKSSHCIFISVFPRDVPILGTSLDQSSIAWRQNHLKTPGTSPQGVEIITCQKGPLGAEIGCGNPGGFSPLPGDPRGNSKQCRPSTPRRVKGIWSRMYLRSCAEPGNQGQMAPPNIFFVSCHHIYIYIT